MPAALDGGSRDSPAHRGRVGGQAAFRTLLWASRLLSRFPWPRKLSHPRDIPQPACGGLAPAGCPALSVLANHPGAVLPLRGLSLFPVPFVMCEQPPHVAPAQRGKTTREAPAEVLPILQRSMGFDGA